MEARIVRSLDHVGLDERHWNELAARSDTNSVFQTYQWTRSWLTAFGADCEPIFVTASDSTGVVGVTPLAVKRRSSRERVIRFLGDGRGDYCDFLTAGDKPHVMATLLEALFAHRPWDMIELKNVPADSRTVEMVRENCRRAGFRFLTDNQFRCPTLLIRDHEEIASRIRNKPNLRRREKYFQRRGRLVCRHLTQMGEIEPYFDRFFAQHVTRWAGGKARACS